MVFGLSSLKPESLTMSERDIPSLLRAASAPSRAIMAITLAIAFGAGLLACAPKVEGDQASTNHKADSAFEAKVHAYLLKNPELLEEMSAALDKKRRDAASANIAAARPELENDSRDPSIGPKDAKLVVVEFFDYQCGFCKQSVGYVTDLPSKHPGVRVVFKELPIFGEASGEAAAAALAANEQGKYVEFHKALFAVKTKLSSSLIDQTARSVGLDVAKLRQDMVRPDIVAHIQKNQELAQRTGVDGTPSFFINGEHVIGANFEAIDTLLAKQ